MKKEIITFLLGAFIMTVVIFSFWEHNRIKVLENWVNQVVVSSQNAQRQAQGQPQRQPQIQPEVK